ncbi:NACHT domain-containing protein [Streptomyces luteogriseus]
MSKTETVESIFVSWAHAHPSWDDERTSHWESTVFSFVELVRSNGIYADVDLYHLSERGIDWTRYGPQAIEKADMVLIAVSDAYKERWEGRNRPTEGAGAAREANVLKGIFDQDQSIFMKKAAVVILPGASAEDLPSELYCLPRFKVRALDSTDIEDLLRMLRAQPKYKPWPVGEPRGVDASDDKDLLHQYRERVRARYAHLDLQSIPVEFEQHRDIELHRLYIKLRSLPKSRQSNHLQVSPDTSVEQIADEIRHIGEQQWQAFHQEPTKQQHQIATPEEVIQRGENAIVMLGVAGAGKSTMMRALAHECAEIDDERLPLYVQLSRVDNLLAQRKADNLIDAVLLLVVRHIASADKRQRLKDEISVAIDAKRVRFLFDGLDEVHSSRMEELREDLIELANISGNRVSVTSRPTNYSFLSGYAHYEILPLRPTDSQEFIEHWFDVLYDMGSERAMGRQDWIRDRVAWLNDQLDDRPQLRDISLNPLMLTFLAILAGEEPRGNLPQFRKDLYREYVDRLFTKWEGQRGPDKNLGDELTIGDLGGAKARSAATWALNRIGVLVHEGYYGESPETMPTEAMIISSLAQDSKANPAFFGETPENLPRGLLNFWEQAGLLNTYALAGKNWYLFRHQTFQEYGAARALASEYSSDVDGLWGRLRPHLFKPGWSEVPPLALACLADVGADVSHVLSPLIKTCESKEERELLLFCARCIAEGSNVALEVREALLAELARIANTDYEVEDSLRSLVSVGWSYPNQVLPLLERIVESDSRDWRKIRAAEAIGKLGSRRMAFPILEKFARDRSIETGWRVVAAWTLGRLGFKETAIDVLKVLAYIEDDQCRAVEAILEFGDVGEAKRILIELGTGKARGWWLRRVCEKLSEIDRSEAIQVLSSLIGETGVSIDDQLYAAGKIGQLSK